MRGRKCCPVGNRIAEIPRANSAITVNQRRCFRMVAPRLLPGPARDLSLAEAFGVKATPPARPGRSAAGRRRPRPSRTACCSGLGSYRCSSRSWLSLSALIAFRAAFGSMPKSLAAFRPRIWSLISSVSCGILVLLDQVVGDLSRRSRSIWLCGLPFQIESVPQRMWSAPATWTIWPSMCMQVVGARHDRMPNVLPSSK